MRSLRDMADLYQHTPKVSIVRTDTCTCTDRNLLFSRAHVLNAARVKAQPLKTAPIRNLLLTRPHVLDAARVRTTRGKGEWITWTTQEIRSC